MTFVGWLQIALYCTVVVALVKPLGGYMTRVFTGERTILSPVRLAINWSMAGLLVLSLVPVFW